MPNKIVGFVVQTDSGRIMTERIGQNPPVAKPLITNTTSFVRNLFTAWKRIHKIRHEKKLSHAVIGALFYEAMYEFLDPKHRNVFLKMLEDEEKSKQKASYDYYDRTPTEPMNLLDDLPS